MKKPPVYNPKHVSFKEKFETLSAADQEKELAKILVGHTKQMRENVLPFFAQRDDPREGPEDSNQAVMLIERSDWSDHADSIADYAFELDFVFRLLRLVVKENPYMVENATRLTAAFCKSAITRSISESRRNLNAILSYFRSEGVGGKVEVIDNLCYQCSQPLGTGRTSLFRGKSYHEACFVCSKCRRNLNGVSFAIDRVTELPICINGCFGDAPIRAPPATVSLGRESFAEKTAERSPQPIAPSRAQAVVIDDAPFLSSNSSDPINDTVDQLVARLQALNVSEVEPFRREAIDGRALKALSEDDLKNELNLKLGDRKKVMILIQSMNK